MKIAYNNSDLNFKILKGDFNMLFGFFYGDWTLILLIAAMIFAFVAQYKVKSTFDKYNRINNQSGLSGAEAARKILDETLDVYFA